MPHTTTQTMLARPSTTNDPRQPDDAISATTSGGDIALPNRANEWVIPCANPRRAGAVQFAIARVAVGNVAPSPTPSSTRQNNSYQNPLTRPTSSVAPAQMMPEM